MRRNVAASWNPNRTTKIDLETQEIAGKSSQKRDARGSGSWKLRPRDGTLPKHLFQTAFTRDFWRFEFHFSRSFWIPRRDSISAHIWYGLRTNQLRCERAYSFSLDGSQNFGAVAKRDQLKLYVVEFCAKALSSRGSLLN